MLLKRRGDYIFNGNHFPSFPLVPISAKGKRSVRKRKVKNGLCSFNLLAAVAASQSTMEFKKTACLLIWSLDMNLKTILRSKKICYKHQRSRRISFKRRKLFKRCSKSASHKVTKAGVLNLHDNNDILEGSCSSATLHRVNGIPSIIIEHLSSHKPEDFHVKLSIKSFTVPELFVEIPKTATVGILKRTVTNAITTFIGDGLHVGVLLQGKNIQDDDRTLIQAGISHATESDALSFILEPNSCLPSRDSNCDEPRIFPPCDGTEALARTLGSHPTICLEAFSVVPACKARQSELVQRRIRRLFTVSEVEALVKAVEKLGTGRWRDVKVHSFDSAKYRTYVDLKDKWKNLVHTARISPQQRRGEHVPQALLDRVLQADAYWSQQHAKLQANTLSAEACLEL